MLTGLTALDIELKTLAPDEASKTQMAQGQSEGNNEKRVKRERRAGGSAAAAACGGTLPAAAAVLFSVVARELEKRRLGNGPANAVQRALQMQQWLALPKGG